MEYLTKESKPRKFPRISTEPRKVEYESSLEWGTEPRKVNHESSLEGGTEPRKLNY